MSKQQRKNDAMISNILWKYDLHAASALGFKNAIRQPFLARFCTLAGLCTVVKYINIISNRFFLRR